MQCSNIFTPFSSISTPSSAFVPIQPLNFFQSWELDNKSEPIVNTNSDIILAKAFFPKKSYNEAYTEKKNMLTETLMKDLNRLKTSILCQTSPKTSFGFLESENKLSTSVTIQRKKTLDSDSPRQHNVSETTSKQDIREVRIGIYTLVERKHKIRKYKEKLKKWRSIHPINRNFEGRRKVAFAKKRFNGRFQKAK